MGQRRVLHGAAPCLAWGSACLLRVACGACTAAGVALDVACIALNLEGSRMWLSIGLGAPHAAMLALLGARSDDRLLQAH
eukprot:167115-Pleurochrysis_carterae.AAC.1